MPSPSRVDLIGIGRAGTPLSPGGRCWLRSAVCDVARAVRHTVWRCRDPPAQCIRPPLRWRCNPRCCRPRSRIRRAHRWRCSPVCRRHQHHIRRGRRSRTTRFCHAIRGDRKGRRRTPLALQSSFRSAAKTDWARRCCRGPRWFAAARKSQSSGTSVAVAVGTGTAGDLVVVGYEIRVAVRLALVRVSRRHRDRQLEHARSRP